MNKADVKATLEDSPITLKGIKNFYLREDPSMKDFLTDGILIISISSSPSSILKYFDTIDLIGALHYEPHTKTFEPYLNGSNIVLQDETVCSENRIEAEYLLINHLLNESEKRLSTE